jgi:hypothetical protein
MTMSNDFIPGGRAMIEIEKNIPLPPKETRQTKYPYARMEVGDSFFVPQTRASKDSVYASIQWAKRKLGFKFILRADNADNDNGGVRAWRVA